MAGGPGWILYQADCLCPRWGLLQLDDGAVDHVIVDPPFSKRTHKGQRAQRRVAKSQGGLLSTSGLEYAAIDGQAVFQLSKQFARVSAGWTNVITSHDLIPAWEEFLGAAFGRYVFAPVSIVRPGSNVRLRGDGPSNWTAYMVVSRPRLRRKWGTKPGSYQPVEDPRQFRGIRGTKPLALMESIVRDYTKPGDLVCDPCSGSGTTGVAAIRLGRRFIGWELDPKTFAIAARRLERTRPQGELFESVLAMPSQASLDLVPVDRSGT